MDYRILFVGLLNTKGWVSTSLMRMVELQRLGHQIDSVDMVPYFGWGGRVAGWPFRRFAFGPPVSGLGRRTMELACQVKPQMLWVDKGIWIKREVLAACRALGCRVLIHYTPDATFYANASRHFRRSIPEYDLLVTTKAYELSRYAQLGAHDVLFQYPSYDRDVHQPPSPTAEEAIRFGSDVVFVGTYGRGRERFLVPVLRMGVNLTIYGGYWDRCPDRALRACVRGPSLAGRDYALALACSKIALGLLSPYVPDRSTTRSMEIPACGTFLLAPRSDEHEALFREDAEAVFFSTEEEVVSKVAYYLSHEKERQRIASAGLARCRSSRYSSADRVAEVMERVARLLH